MDFTFFGRVAQRQLTPSRTNVPLLCIMPAGQPAVCSVSHR
jgi:hypothetical protein